MRKFLAALCAAFMLLTTPASAETQQVDNSDVSAKPLNDSIENFYATLPKAKGDYKSRVRPILIEGAMNTETEVLIRALKNPVAYREMNYMFVAGTYKDYPVVIVRTEIGMANAAASTALAIKKFNPCAVINQGTAGGHDPAIQIGDIVIGEKTIDWIAIKTAYAPTGEIAKILDQEILGTYAYDEASGIFQQHKEFRPDPKFFEVAKKVAAAHSEFNVTTGTISSADAWLINIDYINFLREAYGSSCEEMETNAAAQICQNAGVPFIGIRVLSDNILLSDKYEPETAQVAQNFVLLVVESYIRDVLKK